VNAEAVSNLDQAENDEVAAVVFVVAYLTRA
jgi:hypothetical protein